VINGSDQLKNIIKTNGYVILCCVAAGAAQAQIAPDAGSILRDQQKPALELPARPAPSIKLDEPARPALKRSETRFVLKSIRITGNTAFTQAELLAVVQTDIGKEVGFADLDQAASRVSRYYRERGYMVARAYLPAQDIKDGVVEIAVIEGRFGKVDLNNTSRVRDSVVRNHLNKLPGATVQESTLERKLLLLNDLAGVGEARASLRPGANVGETDLAVEVTPAPLVNGSIEIDNNGNRFTGANRATAKLNLMSPLGLGDSLNALFNKGFNGLDYGRLGYQLPIGSDGFKLGAAYSKSHYRLGKNFAASDSNGDVDTYNVSASYPFIRSRNFNLNGQVNVDWRNFQDRDLAGDRDKQTRSTTATLSGDARDALAGGGISVFSLAYSGGWVDIETPGVLANDDNSAHTNGHYDKWNLNLLRLQNLSQRASLYLSFAGQKGGKNLDSSEKFVLGGAQGVRAYPQGEAAGDSGYIATAELRYTVAPGAMLGVLQPFVFFDVGGVTINQYPFVANQANRRTLSGAGFGLNWLKTNDFQVKLTVATRVGSQASVSSDTDRHTRGWVQVIKYF
jgi:hemolysin activation/secretion protein